jgi:hypothetical protein
LPMATLYPPSMSSLNCIISAPFLRCFQRRYFITHCPQST